MAISLKFEQKSHPAAPCLKEEATAFGESFPLPVFVLFVRALS
jgi:hypothetical protein